jgi:basic amino acid/polyamine antiporter, APA family
VGAASVSGSHVGEAGPQGTALNRVISQRMLLVFVVGDVLGAGIYALVGEVAGEVGGAVWTAFALALVLAIFTAFAYAELVTKYPHAGGAAVYVHRAAGIPFVTFMVAFAVMASGITSAATLSRAFAGDYFGEFLDVPVIPVALAFIAVVAGVNFRGISESVKLNVGLTAVEVTGLVLIVLVGVVALAQGDGEPGRNFEFSADSSVPLVILSGAALSFYALIGFEDSVNVAEETRNPSRAFPRALFGGLLVAGTIYFLVTFTASMVVPTAQLSASDGPLLEVVRQGPLGIPTKLFSAIALLAVTNGALINMIMASRLLYGMAKQGIVPRPFARVHDRRLTPYVAIAFTTLLAMALITLGDLSDLAATTVTLLLLVFIAVNLAVLVLRRDAVAHEHFRTPTAIPAIGIVVCIGLLTQREGRIFAFAAGLLAIGVLFWVLNRLVAGRADTVDPEQLRGD